MTRRSSCTSIRAARCMMSLRSPTFTAQEAGLSLRANQMLVDGLNNDVFESLAGMRETDLTDVVLEFSGSKHGSGSNGQPDRTESAARWLLSMLYEVGAFFSPLHTFAAC